MRPVNEDPVPPIKSKNVLLLLSCLTSRKLPKISPYIIPTIPPLIFPKNSLPNRNPTIKKKKTEFLKNPLILSNYCMNFYENMYSIDGNNNLMNSAAASWNRQEDKVFEKALVEFPEGIGDRWRKIAEFLPGKSSDEVKAHYEALLYDITEIDSGRVELPSYSDESASLGWDNERARSRMPGQISFGSPGNRGRHSEVERKKGTPWTEDEHRFLFFFSKKYRNIFAFFCAILCFLKRMFPKKSDSFFILINFIYYLRIFFFWYLYFVSLILKLMKTEYLLFLGDKILHDCHIKFRGLVSKRVCIRVFCFFFLFFFAVFGYVKKMCSI